MHKMPGLHKPAGHEAHENDAWLADGEEDLDFKPLTRDEAREWRAGQRNVSVWWLVRVQVLVGLAMALTTGLLTQRAGLAVSVLYGAAVVALPSALMAYGITSSALSRMLAGVAQAAFAGFLMWEGIKIVLAVAMMWLAPMFIPELSWLGLVVGMVVTLKVYWFGFWVRTRGSKQTG